MQSYEVEVKSLLGNSEVVDALRKRMRALDLNCKLESKNQQLNHYFIGGYLNKLVDRIAPHLSAEKNATLADLVSKAKEYSVRTREKDASTALSTSGTVLLVLKVSVDDTTS